MIEVLGWMSLALVGGYFVVSGVVVIALTLMRGGLETIPHALILGALAGLGWLAVFVWLSPLSFGWG